MQKKFMYLLGVALILLTTYAYSALATNLAITGEATFRTPADIRITDVSLNGTPTGATQRYEPIFKKNTITAGFTLDSSSSSISYDVTVTNSGLIDQAIYNFTTLSSNNNGLTILIDGQPINQALPIIVPFGTSRTITITYSSSTPGAVDVINQIDFRKVYYVEYNTKGGSTIATQTKFENVDLTLTTDEPTKTGKIFEGWTDEQDGTTVKFDPGDTYTLNENKILYAIYSDSLHEITLNSQSSTTSGTTTIYEKYNEGFYLDSQSLNKMTTSTNPITPPTKTGYIFGGYYTQTNGEGSKFIDENGFLTSNASTTQFTSSNNLYAKWTPGLYTITLNNQNATSAGTQAIYQEYETNYYLDNTKINVMTTTTNPITKPIRTGYTFGGYYTQTNGNGTQYIDSTGKLTNNVSNTDFTENSTLYAKWTVNTYTVVFNKNNDSATGTMSNQSFTYGTAQNLTANAFEYTSHTFVGWNTEPDGSGTAYLDEASVNNLTSTNNGTVTLYAQWITANATFATGAVVNAKMKSLAAGTTKTYSDYDSLITSIEYSSTIPSQYKTSDYVVSSSTSQTKIYMWYDNGAIKWWSEDSNPKLNSTSSYMFSRLTSVTSIDTTDFNTSNVTNMGTGYRSGNSGSAWGSGLFYNCSSLTSLDLSSFDTSSVTQMGELFYGCRNLTNITFGNNFDTSKVTNMSEMFSGCSGLTTLNLSNFDTSKVTNMGYMFYDCSGLATLDLSSFDTSSVTQMGALFRNCSGLANITFGDDFDTGKVTLMSYMFYDCSNLATLDLSSFDTNKVTDMSEMFSGCSGLTALDLRSFDTSSVTNMSAMFKGCSSLTTLDLSSFDTSSVTNMGNNAYIDIKTTSGIGNGGMFEGCSGLATLDLSSFDTSSVTQMGALFRNCSGLANITFGDDFDTSKVRNISAMFEGCSSLTMLDLSNFDTNSVVYMGLMFEGDTNLETIFASDNFVTTAVTNSTKMFLNCTSINGFNGTTYDSNYIDKTYAKIDHGQSDPGYFRYKGTNVRAVDLYYDNTNTGMTCETAQCALDNIARMLRRAGSISTGNDYLCKRATSAQLHTETCNQSSNYCASVEGNGNTITYGQVGTSGTLASGDAFICDVNGDGTYNATNEMFYYVSNYFDTSTTTSNTEYATLVYYNNVSEGSPSNSTTYVYDSSNENWHGPRTAINQLPTSIQWQDVGLYKNSRAILAEYQSTHNSTTTSGGTLPTDFSYRGFSGRLLTAQELMSGCGLIQVGSYVTGELDNCKFLLENTKYSSSSLASYGSWLETPSASNSISVWHVDGSSRYVSDNGASNSGSRGVRPVIEVLKSDISY